MRAASALLLLTACTSEGSLGTTGPSERRTQVALVADYQVNHNLDLLFVIDDSPGMQPIQEALVAAFPAFIESLAGVPDGLPSLHIGVISSDMGTKAFADPQPAPAIGSGPGMCLGVGKNGVLVTSPLLSNQSWINDIVGMGGRERNYTSTIGEAFASIAQLGYQGCGFEQPLHAATTAFERPENAGFRRPVAKLAVIVVANEDDCSVERTGLFGIESSTLGPLQSFRCTRFGVTCEHGGRTTDEMNQVGPKRNCHANDSLAYLTSVRDHAAAFRALAADPRDVVFAAIAAEATSLEVELQTPPGGGTAIPTLKEQCAGGTSSTEPWAEVLPAVRLTDHAKAFERGRVTTMCNGNVQTPLLDVAREIRGMFGDACLTRDIALPADCEAFDTNAGGITRPLRECARPGTGDCWELITDPGCAGQGRRLHVIRTSTSSVPIETQVSLRCVL